MFWQLPGNASRLGLRNARTQGDSYYYAYRPGLDEPASQKFYVILDAVSYA